MMGSFTQKLITLTFKLGTGTFGETGSNIVTFSGLRCTVQIVAAGGPSMGQASIRIFGLTMSQMNSLSSVVRQADGQIATRLNSIQITAGDSSSMPVIFQGQVTSAIIDMSGMPDTAMVFAAHAGAFEAIKIVPASSYPGAADAAVILATLAQQNGYAFENNGVSVLLSTPYFSGSPRDQMLACVRAAGIEWNGLDNGTLAIWPKGGYRGQANNVPLISAATGMIGYPVNRDYAITVRTLFNPQILNGQVFEIQSGLLYANGKFIAHEIAHDISCEMPGGPWFSTFTGTPLNAQS